MSTVAAVILGRERRMVNRLRMAGATSPTQARTLEELGLAEGLILHRLRDRAVIRHAGPERYYLDEESWNAVRRSRRRAIHVTWLIALIILLAILFGRTAFAPWFESSRRTSAIRHDAVDSSANLRQKVVMKIRSAVVVPVAGLALVAGSLALSPSARAAAANAAATMIEVEGEGAKYWSRWRGPSGQGIVKSGKYRDKWSPTEGVKWKSAVPGRGHSSPIVWGDHIFLTTEYDNGARLSMLAFRRSDGKQLWETFVPTDSVEHVYPKNSRASATPVTDGKLVYASFGTHGLAAFDFEGKMVWHTPVGRLNNYHGTAGSPILYKDRLFIYQDHKGSESTPSFVAAFDKNTGKQIWKTPRTEQTGWGTPVVIRAGDRDELIVSSSRRVAAYDPGSGKELWTVSGLTFEVIPTPVVAEGLVICSSGRQGPTIAIRPGGSGDVTQTHVAWSSPKGSPFVPSGVVVDGILYLVNDIQSILTAHDVKTGEVLYQGRLGVARKEGFSASPIAHDGKVFFTNDDGETFVLQAGREFKLLHTNTLGESTLASPALVDGRWYFRTASSLVAIE